MLLSLLAGKKSFFASTLFASAIDAFICISLKWFSLYVLFNFLDVDSYICHAIVSVTQASIPTFYRLSTSNGLSPPSITWSGTRS